MSHLTRPLEAAFTVTVAGLLWMLASVPLVTLGPATAALCSVMVAWDENGPPAVWSTFWSGLRRHFRQGLLLGVLAVLAGVLLSIDLLYGLRAEDAPLRIAVLVVAIFGILALGGTLLFAYPGMVEHPGPWRQVVRNSALFAAAYPLTTLAGLAILGVLGLGVTIMPASLPVAAGLAAWAITRLTQRAFRRFLARRGEQQAAKSIAST
jgi:uncharacterized membrane protein YesL